MAAGDLTVTRTRYATLELAIAAMDAENLPAATDTLQLFITSAADDSEPGTAVGGFVVVKSVRAAA